MNKEVKIIKVIKLSRLRIWVLYSMFYMLLILAIIIGVKNKQYEELKEKNYCYTILVNEDYITPGCEKHFENDIWYQDYLEAVEMYERSIEDELNEA